MTNETHSDNKKTESNKEINQAEPVTIDNYQSFEPNSSKKSKTSPAVIALVVIALSSSLYNLQLTKNLSADLSSSYFVLKW